MWFMFLPVMSVSAAANFMSIALCTTHYAKVKLPENVTIPAVFTFGDSIVDTGNNNYLCTIAKSNFPPYGRDFMGGKPTGRFSDGKLPSDLIVEDLGIKEQLPPFLDPNLQTKDLLTGVNFASSASGYDPLTPAILSVMTLSDQLDLFDKYKKELKGHFGEERTNFITSNSLFLVVAGSNDIATTYFHTPFRILIYNESSYTDMLSCSASKFLQELYDLGARRIGVLSVPPVGCLPVQRTLAGGIERRCVDEYNKVAELLNSKLSKKLDLLNSKLPRARMVFMDAYPLILEIIQNPQDFGFEVADRGCCGTGLIEVAFMCNQWNPFTSRDVSRFFFWDGYHPTEKGYRIIVHHLLQNLVNQFSGT